MAGYNEEAYREARQAAITLACPFERALLSCCVQCHKAQRLLLAEREAISCTEVPTCDRCRAFHAALRQSARFALRMTLNQPWPFGKEIRAQCGGVLGLREVLDPEGAGPADVARLLDAAIERFAGVEHFPYSTLMRAVVHYEPRMRRGGRHPPSPP